MKKGFLIIVISVATFAAIGSAIGVYSSVKNKYSKEILAKAAENNSIKSELYRINQDKDKNGYLPSDVVKNFMGEVKSEAYDRAKLYLSNNLQSADIKKDLDFGYPVTSLQAKDVTYEVTDQKAFVKYYYVPENQSDEDLKLFRGFSLEMVDSVWKITSLKNIEG